MTTTEASDELQDAIDKSLRDFGKAGKARLARYFKITIAIAILTDVIFSIAFTVYPSESHLDAVANMTTQLSGILIGFWAIAVFYFLGAVNSQRDRVIQMQSSLSVRVEYKGVNVTERLSNDMSRIANTYAMINGFMINTTLFCVFYFGAAAFLAMFSIVITLDMPLNTGLAFLIAGISGMVVTMIDVQKMLDLLALVQSQVARAIAEDMRLGQQIDRVREPPNPRDMN